MRRRFTSALRRARALIDTGQIAHAMTLLDTLEMDQNTPEVAMLKAEIAMRGGLWRVALMLLEEIAQTVPDDPQMQLNRALCLFELECFDEAEAIIEAHRQLLDGCFPAHILLARIAHRAGSPDEALAHLTIAWKLDARAVEVIKTIPELRQMVAQKLALSRKHSTDYLN
jgi:tetratricopeptide (TPR) repeat protein